MTNAENDVRFRSDTERFGATLSRAMRIATWAIGYGVGLGIPLIVAASIYRTSHDPRILCLPLVFVAILGVAYSFRPSDFSVTPDSLRVERPIGAVVVPLSQIAAVTSARPFLSGRTLGLFRVSGFYGAYGRFWNRAVGSFDAYLTGQPGMIAIRRLKGRPLVISPDDLPGLLDALERRARASGRVFPIERDGIST